MTKPKPTRKQSPRPPSAFEKVMHDMQHQPPAAFPNVSPLWLLKAASFALLAALALAWLALCLLYWQGSWQLLYHPRTEITRTPASAAGMSYESISFAATETGVTQLTGWWLPNTNASRTILYLHGADGNLSDTVDALVALHAQNLSIFAIDYRGYGKSLPIQAGHPNEKQLRQDVEWALTWLTLTRNIPAKNIAVYGSGLGANLAAELAADHSELAGVILDQPSADPLAPVFNDSRSHLVPAHRLVKDRYDLTAAARSLRIPSLWLLPSGPEATPPAYNAVETQKTLVWLNPPIFTDLHFSETLHRWLDDL